MAAAHLRLKRRLEGLREARNPATLLLKHAVDLVLVFQLQGCGGVVRVHA